MPEASTTITIIDHEGRTITFTPKVFDVRPTRQMSDTQKRKIAKKFHDLKVETSRAVRER